MQRVTLAMGVLGIALAIAILILPGLFSGGSFAPASQLTNSATGASVASSAPNSATNPYFVSVTAPSHLSSSQAIISLSTSSIGILALLGGISLAVGFGTFFVIARRIK